MTTGEELSLIHIVLEAIVPFLSIQSGRLDHRKSQELYRRFLETADEKEAMDCRSKLLFDIAEPLINTIVYKLTGVRRNGMFRRPWQRDEEAEETHSRALEIMAKQMERWRSNPHRDPEKLNFEAYMTTVTRHTWMQLLREKGKFLARSMELLDLLNHGRDLACWTNMQGELLGGYVLWREHQVCAAADDRVRAILADPLASARKGLADKGHKLHLAQTNPVDVLKALLNQAGGPMRYDDLVRAFDEYLSFWGSKPCEVGNVSLQEQPGADNPDSSGPVAFQHADPDVDIAGQHQIRSYLRSLWLVAGELPLNHRIALFLNLRDIDQIIPFEIATFDDVASMVARTPNELAEIWNKLPLDDEAIAADLTKRARRQGRAEGVTVEQVRNYRQNAYSALAWRFRAYNRADVRALWLEAILLEIPRPAVTMLYLRDPDRVSILTLLPDVSTTQVPLDKATIAQALNIDIVKFRNLWKRLPLGFEAIGKEVGKTKLDVYALWVESRELLKDRLAVIWAEG